MQGAGRDTSGSARPAAESSPHASKLVASKGAAKTPAKSKRPLSASGKSIAPEPEISGDLTGQLQYEFTDPRLLQLALTHSSHVYEARLGRAKASGDEPNQPGTDNEQMEFLGDAVLGLAVTELLLRAFPERTEGELTRMRATLVSRQRMAELGAVLGLGPLLLMGKSAEAVEGRAKPAVLANTAEALLGAVYLDVSRGVDARARAGEKALRTVRDILDRLVVTPGLPLIRAALEASPGRGALRDAKSRLQERVQAEAAGRLLYTDTGEIGPAHARHFTVAVQIERRTGEVHTLATGEGASKKAAQQAAAEIAMTRWGITREGATAAAQGDPPA